MVAVAYRRGRLGELLITKFKSQLKWGFVKVVVTRAGCLQEWSQGELRPYHERSCCGQFEAENPERYKSAFLTPKKYDAPPCPFYMGTPRIFSETITPSHCCLKFIFDLL